MKANQHQHRVRSATTLADVAMQTIRDREERIASIALDLSYGDPVTLSGEDAAVVAIALKYCLAQRKRETLQAGAN